MAKEAETRELYAVDEEVEIDDIPKKRRIGKKLLLIIAGLIVAGVAAFVAFRFMTKEEKIVVDTYRIGLDTVSSITSIVGERNMKEIVRYDVDDVSKVEYLYEADEQTEADLEAYRTYLTEESGFAEMETEESEAPEGTTVQQYGIASIEDGMIFTVEIAQQQDQYAITVSKVEGKDPNAEPLTEFNRNDALAYFESNIEKYADLPKPISEYETIFDVGQSNINGEDCYGITVYDKNSVNTNQFVEKYYIALATQNIYLYDNMTRESTQINEKQTTQQTQTQKQGEVTVGAPNPAEEIQQAAQQVVQQETK